MEAAAIGPVQQGRLTHRLIGLQPRHTLGAEGLIGHIATKQKRRIAPQQLGRRFAHQRHERRVELAQVPVANQHDGRGIVKNGRLLLQQFVEQALAPLQLGLRAHALGHLFVQAHNRNALAPRIKHGRQGRLVVVSAAVTALVHKMALPGLP